MLDSTFKHSAELVLEMTWYLGDVVEDIDALVGGQRSGICIEEREIAVDSGNSGSQDRS